MSERLNSDGSETWFYQTISLLNMRPTLESTQKAEPVRVEFNQNIASYQISLVVTQTCIVLD